MKYMKKIVAFQTQKLKKIKGGKKQLEGVRLA